MQLELTFPNQARTLPGITAFVDTTLRQYALAEDVAAGLSATTCEAVGHAIEFAYPRGEDGLIKLTISEAAGKLEIRIRDFGLPQDIQARENELHARSMSGYRLHGQGNGGAVDEMHWLAFGSQGKALQLIKWLEATDIASSAPAQDLTRFQSNVPLAPEQQYEVRRLRREEAVQVSQLIYRTYGTTYFSEDVYFPERIVAQNKQGSLISIVAVGENGDVAGHCALERNVSGSVAEVGQAAVNPAHRGRGLLDRMKQALEVEARSAGLAGWYADSVTVHTFTQQSNAHHHGHVCGVDLAISPRTEAFRTIADKQAQRVSCICYFHWLQSPVKRTVHVPSRHQEVVTEIYKNLECPVEFGQPAAPLQPHGKMLVRFDRRTALARIKIGEIGQDSAQAIRHSCRQLVELSRAEVVFVELPLHDPATVQLCEDLEQSGFGFLGIGPHFSERGDTLKLAYIVEPLSSEPIKTYEPFAQCLVEYALAEQQRVRADL